jgi:hypothetical protein
MFKVGKYFLSFCLLTLVGCASPKLALRYSENQGNVPVPSQTGTVKQIEGVDYWENGGPDRKYKIIGIIDQDTTNTYNGSRQSAARLAKEKGGDGLMQYDSHAEFMGTMFNGSASRERYKYHLKLAVFKYVQ